MKELKGDMTKAVVHDDYNRMPLIRRWLEEFPFFQNCCILEVDCLGMRDPWHNKNLRNHTGRHPVTMEGVAMNIDQWDMDELCIKFEQWLSNPEQDLVILPLCRRERHRSVAFRQLLSDWLKTRFPDLP